MARPLEPLPPPMLAPDGRIVVHPDSWPRERVIRRDRLIKLPDPAGTWVNPDSVEAVKIEWEHARFGSEAGDDPGPDEYRVTVIARTVRVMIPGVMARATAALLAESIAQAVNDAVRHPALQGPPPQESEPQNISPREY